MSDLFTRLWVRVSNALYREEGQAVTEYAVVLVLIAGLIAAAQVAGVGDKVVAKVTAALAKINP